MRGRIRAAESEAEWNYLGSALLPSNFDARRRFHKPGRGVPRLRDYFRRRIAHLLWLAGQAPGRLFGEVFGQLGPRIPQGAALRERPPVFFRRPEGLAFVRHLREAGRGSAQETPVDPSLQQATTVPARGG